MNDPTPLFDLPAPDPAAAGEGTRAKKKPDTGIKWGKHSGKKRQPCDRCVQGRHEAEMACRRPGGVVLGPLPALADARLTRTAEDGTKSHYCEEHGKLRQMLDLAAANARGAA